jgi:hypothetical protein
MKGMVNPMSTSWNTRQGSREPEPTLEDILKLLGVPAIPDVDPSDPDYQELRARFLKTSREQLKEEGPEKFSQMRKAHLGGWRLAAGVDSVLTSELSPGVFEVSIELDGVKYTRTKLVNISKGLGGYAAWTSPDGPVTDLKLKRRLLAALKKWHTAATTSPEGSDRGTGNDGRGSEIEGTADRSGSSNQRVEAPASRTGKKNTPGGSQTSSGNSCSKMMNTHQIIGTMKGMTNQMSTSCNTRYGSLESEPTLEDILKLLGVPAIPDIDQNEPAYHDLRMFFLTTSRKIIKEEGPEKFSQRRNAHLAGWQAFLAQY